MSNVGRWRSDLEWLGGGAGVAARGSADTANQARPVHSGP